MTERFQTVISWTDSQGSPGFMVFDAVEAIGHRRTVELTESPVDDGAPVADHAYMAPDSLTMTGLISNSPLPSNPAVGESSEYMGAPIMEPTNIVFQLPKPPPIAQLYTPGGATSAAVGALDRLGGKSAPTEAAGVWVNTAGFLDRVALAFDTLGFMQSEFSRCTINTKLADYENMVLTSMVVPENFDSGDLKSFTLEFRQILTASTTTVNAPEPAEVRGSPPTQGSKQTEKADNADEKADKARRSSLLKKGLDWAIDGISP